MTIDKNGKVVKIGDIVRVANNPVKSDNGLYVVAQDGTSEYYNSKDGLTMYKLAKHKDGYCISKGTYNLCFYPFQCFSNKYHYTRKDFEAATIEVITEANPNKKSLVKISNEYEPENEEFYYYSEIADENGKRIEDVSYSANQPELLTAFHSNLTLKAGRKLTIKKICRNNNYYRYQSSYKLV